MPVLRTVALICAAAGCGAVVALIVVLAGNAALGVGRLSALAELVVGGACGLTVMAVVATRLPLPEVREILSAVRRTPA
jgi:hypothetical protein